MRKLKDQELNEINGGFSGWVLAGISILVTFVAGVIDGIARRTRICGRWGRCIACNSG